MTRGTPIHGNPQLGFGQFDSKHDQDDQGSWFIQIGIGQRLSKMKDLEKTDSAHGRESIRCNGHLIFTHSHMMGIQLAGISWVLKWDMIGSVTT